MKILVVDDSQEDRFLLENVLHYYGYEAETASDGIEALEKARQGGFDLIISDILMPGMDGFQLCRKVKTDEKLKNLAFVFYTATYTSTRDKEFALKQGAEEFIMKPQEPEVFIEVLRRVIEKYEAGMVTGPSLPPEEESVYFKHYSERLIRKLDDKLLQLEAANKTLAAEKERLALILRAKERLALILRSIDDGVIATDQAGRIDLTNKVAEEMTGWSRSEDMGRPLREVLFIINERTGEDRQNEIVEVIKTSRAIDLERDTVLISRDGKRRMIAGHAAPLQDQEGKTIGMVMVFRDITEKRKMEEELQKASKLESVGLLAGGIAHNFNNILTAVVGNISLTKTLTSPADERFKLLTQAEKAAGRAKSLTKQLLTFAKGGVPIRKITSISALIKDSAEFALKGSRVRCNFSLSDDLWQAEIDEGQMSQVINNMIINADQAMTEGGIIRLRAENTSLEKERVIHGTILPKGRYVEISIQDQGVGIPKEHLDKIFDPYFTTKQTGSGLGLTASYYIVKKHDGYLAVESEPGRGTTFFIYLPASTREMPKEIPASEEAEERLLPGQGRILIMDDEEIVRDIIGKILSALGYEVASAEDGEEAIGIYQEARESGHPFAAVIMDLIIPGGMGGDVAVKKLFEVDPYAKVIVSSGYSTNPIMANFRQYGFCGCLAKPYDIQVLSKTLHEVIEK